MHAMQALSRRRIVRSCLTNVPMLPHPGAKDWKVEGVLRYPAKFKQRYQRSAGTPREFKFSWFERDWLVQQDPEVLPHLIHRTYQNNRVCCEEVSGSVLRSD
jgi:hypothetical protein